MTITLATTTPRHRAPARVAAAVVAGIVAVAGLGLVASTAGASTLNGTATIASPGTSNALASGGSATQFTLDLPAQAACTGDTSTHGYHVYSYLVPKGTALSGVTFINFPSTGYGLVDTNGTYYGPVNTTVGTALIIGVPNDFEWGPLVNTDGGSVTLAQLLYSGGTTGVWEAGLVCADTTGKVSDNWNTEVTFSASSSDAHGFTWAAVPGPSTTTTTTTTTTTSSTTTTTTDPATTTTTLESGATTTTPTTAVTATTDPGTGSSTRSDVSASSTTPDGSGGTLAFTGIHTVKGLGVGILAVGLGLMLLGWGYRRKFRPAREAKKLD